VKLFSRKIAIVLLLIAQPTALFAQVSLKSSNFTMDDVNFSSNFILTTSQDSVPPVISSQGPQIVELNHNKVTIKWDTDKKSSSLVQYGTTISYGQETGTSDQSVAHQVTVYGLEPETQYHYRVKSVDAFNSVGFSEDHTFTTPAENGLNSIKVSDITYTSALVSWTTGNTTREEVQYGTTTNYGSSVKGASLSFTTNHTVKLDNLNAGTDYHFRIVATGADGNVERSNDLQFSTLADPKFQPITVTPESANIVNVSWKTNTRTSTVLRYKAIDNPEFTAELTAGDSSYLTTHNLKLQQLIGKTTYSFTITATDEQGRQIISAPQTFVTPADTTPPKITDLKVSATRSGDDIILTATWKTDEPTKSRVAVAPKTDKSLKELPPIESLTTQHTVVTAGLKPGLPYLLRAVAVDPFNNESQDEISFVSPKLNKSILTLLADIFTRSFGWLLNLGGK
jgi:hypothetical protein